MLLPLKDNIGISRQGLMFRIEITSLLDGIRTARIVFCDEPAMLTAEQALTALQTAPGKTSILDETKDFLRDFLQAGSQSVGAVQAAADANGFSTASVRRARALLRIKPKKGGMSEGWVWALPEMHDGSGSGVEPEGDQNIEHAHPTVLSIFTSVSTFGQWTTALLNPETHERLAMKRKAEPMRCRRTLDLFPQSVETAARDDGRAATCDVVVPPGDHVI